MLEFLTQHQFWAALLLALMVLSATACAAHYTVHSGALNAADSAAYDALLIAEAAIDEARAENQIRPLPPEAKDALNALVESYNIARDAWLVYRGAVATNMPSDPYFQQLSKNVADLTNAIRNLKQKGVQQ